MQYVWSFFKNTIKTLVTYIYQIQYTFFGLTYPSSTLISLYLVGNTKNEARDKATQEALDMLSKKCYTILVKNKYLSVQGETIDANELSNPLNANNGSKPTGNKTQLPASNIGHKLLQKMGWTGGGLGKGGSGISEPITAQGIVTREGFGTKNASHQFKQKIRQIVEEYAASSNPYDLVFTSGFENEQRKEIHL